AGFYDIADYRPLLSRLKQVTIRYGPSKTDPDLIPTRAMLLGGWLASRLGWKLNPGSAKRAAGSVSFEFSAEGRSFMVEFAHTRREVEPGHLSLVTLETEADEPVSFTVRRSADGQRIETSVTRGEEKGLQRVL